MPGDIDQCVAAMTGKVDNPHAFCNWAKQHGKGPYAHAEFPDNIASAVREYAEQQRQARKHSEGNSNGMATLTGVEIFAAGTERGQTYTEAHLDEMVANFQKFSTGAKPGVSIPAVLGHEETQEFLDRTDLPAAGWATRLYRDGSILKADFADVPPQVARLLKQKAYKKVSAEVYDSPKAAGLEGAGKMLRRVAFLGGEIPQVKSLDDIPAPVFGERRFDTAIRRMVLRLADVKPANRAGAYHVFSEVRMDRKQLEEQAATLGLTPETIKLLDDEVLGQVVLNLLAAKGGAMPAPEPAPESKPMSEPTAPDKLAEPMPAVTPAPAQRQPTKVVMSYAEQQALIKTTVQEVVGTAIAALQKPLTEKVTALAKFAEDAQAAQKKAGIKAKLDLLVQQGKVLPAEIDGGLSDVAFHLEASKVHKFSEAGKEVSRTPLDHFFASLEARPALAKFAERAKSGKAGAGSADDELAKVQQYAEDPECVTTLRALGRTPADYVAKFSEAKKKIPSLTAAAYGVPSLNGSHN